MARATLSPLGTVQQYHGDGSSLQTLHATFSAARLWLLDHGYRYIDTNRHQIQRWHHEDPPAPDPGLLADLKTTWRPLAVPLPPAPQLSAGELWLWLDALTRQYGPDLPLYVQGSSPDAPAERCLDARVQRGPCGKRVVVLSAQALPPRED